MNELSEPAWWRLRWLIPAGTGDWIGQAILWMWLFSMARALILALVSLVFQILSPTSVMAWEDSPLLWIWAAGATSALILTPRERVDDA